MSLVAIPRLPGGADLYVHLLWAQQVMRCLAAGQLPLWLPDLNAGFGSPGIRLYSPLAPVVDGALGLTLGDAGRGMRAGAVLALALLAMLLVRARGRRGWLEWLLLLASPMIAYDLWGRSAWSEVLALPALWFLLEEALARRARPVLHGTVLGALWLLHAPSTLLAGLVVGGLVVADRDPRQFARWAGAAAIAAGLTAWHWLPLASEMSTLGAREALVAGIFEPARNLLGSPRAHALGDSIALGWAAVGLLGAVLAGRWWRGAPRRTAVVVGAAFLASWPARPLWAAVSALDWLQFPWRLLLPATLLAARQPFTERTWHAVLSAGMLVVPLALVPFPPLVSAPHLTAADGWRAAGEKVYRAIGANPLVVDAAQNRPRSWRLLDENLRRFGEARRVLVDAPGEAAILRWEPLAREVEVEARMAATVSLRLLAYPGWAATVDGREAAVETDSGVVAVRVPAGRHVVDVRWEGNPWAKVGLAATGVTMLWAALVLWRRSAGPSRA